MEHYVIYRDGDLVVEVIFTDIREMFEYALGLTDAGVEIIESGSVLS